MPQATSTNHRRRCYVPITEAVQQNADMASGGSSWRNFDDDLINVVKHYTVLYDVTMKGVQAGDDEISNVSVDKAMLLLRLAFPGVDGLQASRSGPVQTAKLVCWQQLATISSGRTAICSNVKHRRPLDLRDKCVQLRHKRNLPLRQSVPRYCVKRYCSAAFIASPSKRRLWWLNYTRAQFWHPTEQNAFVWLFTRLSQHCQSVTALIRPAIIMMPTPLRSKSTTWLCTKRRTSTQKRRSWRHYSSGEEQAALPLPQYLGRSAQNDCLQSMQISLPHQLCEHSWKCQEW